MGQAALADAWICNGWDKGNIVQRGRESFLEFKSQFLYGYVMQKKLLGHKLHQKLLRFRFANWDKKQELLENQSNSGKERTCLDFIAKATL